MRLPEGRVLTFDIECRPTAWIGGDFVGRSITAFAAKWLGEPDESIICFVLTREDTSVFRIVDPLANLLEDATVIVGHYIRGFDLPVVSGDLERVFEPALPRLVTVDTKLDRISTSGLSESLDNLVTRYELEHPKEHMREPMWEEHNLWQTPRSVKWVHDRVISDVLATEELYQTLEGYDRLKSPKVWDPTSGKMPSYRR
jgi:hypothetical protein